MAFTPTRYGVAFGRTYLMQGGALLHVYTDGSVLLTHGGTELGQGLHTKMVQVLILSLLQSARSCWHASLSLGWGGTNDLKTVLRMVF